MAFETGTATDYRDLMVKFRAFITGNADLVAAGQEWTELRWASAADTQELIIEGPGLAGTDAIYCGIRTFEDASLGRYIWEMNGFIGYNAANAFNDQPGAIQQSDYPPKMTLANASMSYWFVANGRRAVIVAKNGSIYEAAYIGFMLPYATPGEYPYPLVVGGSTTGESTSLDSSNQSASHRAFPGPGGNSSSSAQPSTLAIRAQDGAWIRPRTHYGANDYNASPSTSNTEGVLPVWATRSANIRENIDGGYTLYPLQPVRTSNSPSKGVLGELDGCFWVPGFNQAAENIIQVGGIDHIVFQNVHRTGNRDYWALKQE